jgi:signal transduction histidine kinase
LSQWFIAAESLASSRHGLLNKLAGIGNIAYLLRHWMAHLPLTDPDPEIVDSLRLLSQEVAEAASILDRRVLGAPVASPPLDVADTARAVLGVVLSPAHIQVVPPRAQPLWAKVDLDELMLCLFCLVENSLEALWEQGGTVTLTCAAEAKTESLKQVAIDVLDDGPGLGQEARSQLFEPFFSTKPDHVGLGLNVARRIAGRWHGRLDVSQRSEGGVRARLVLPGIPDHER